MDQGSSWMRMILKWLCISRMELTIKAFLWTFWKKILSLFTIIVYYSCSQPNELTWPYFHRSPNTSFDAIPCWNGSSKMDMILSPPDVLLNNWCIWKCVDIVCLSWFQGMEDWSCCWLCSTNQVCNGSLTYEVYCTLCILIPKSYKRKLNDPISNSFYTEGYPGSC